MKLIFDICFKWAEFTYVIFRLSVAWHDILISVCMWGKAAFMCFVFYVISYVASRWFYNNRVQVISGF